MVAIYPYPHIIKSIYYMCANNLSMVVLLHLVYRDGHGTQHYIVIFKVLLCAVPIFLLSNQMTFHLLVL